MKKGTILLVLIITIFAETGWSYSNYKPLLNKNSHRTKNSKGQITDTPAEFWWLYWTGVGDLSDWTVSNTMQGGHFARPPDQLISHFDATDIQQVEIQRYRSSATIGKTGEYPTGSQQYYAYFAGLWVGAIYPLIDSVTGDTSWIPNVSKGAPYSDMGGMLIPELQNAGEAGNVGRTGLTFSTQKIPSPYIHKDGFLFKQPFTSQEPYQALWCFADTNINSRRPAAIKVNPANGDIISDEDSYSVGGDWVPADSASCIWLLDSGPYDSLGLGIRIEQRTYSFNMPENKDYIYINYKIRNMNPFPLKNIYCGYFMDNDVGGATVDTAQGCVDDMVNYDPTLNLGYSYDSDGYEPGWITTAGYIGCVLCETPGNLGFTGFPLWNIYDTLVDDISQDSLKYKKLADTTFCYNTSPQDVRQLSSSGPYPTLMPGEEVDFTVAIVCAYTLSELKERAQNAITQFNDGYLPQCPLVRGIQAIPPVVNPGDSVTILSWSYDKDGIQQINAAIESPDENVCANIQLYDDGLHNDNLPNDHIYGNIWVTQSQGKNYLVDVISRDSTGDSTLIDNGTKFTTLGPLVINSWKILNTDTIPSPGDSLTIEITVKNTGLSQLCAISGELIPDIYAINLDSTHILGDINSQTAVTQNYKIKIYETALDTTIFLILQLRDSATGIWEDTIVLKITDDKGPFLHYPMVAPTLLSAGSAVSFKAKLIDGSGISASVDIESPLGTLITTIALYDDGAHSDSLAGDGFYGNSWTTTISQDRFYNVNLIAKDNLENQKQYTNLMEFTTKAFEKTADILLVDDDNYNRPPLGNIKPYDKYYTEALDSNGYNYDRWDVFCYGSPDTSILYKYRIIIWLTGTTYDSTMWEQEYYNSTSITYEEQMSILLYLTLHYGRMLLSTQAISHMSKLFLPLGISNNGITGVNSDAITGIYGNSISNGLNFSITGGTGADNQFFKSAIKPRLSGSYRGDSLFKYIGYTGEGFAGIVSGDSTRWATVTLPFGFEAIDQQSVRIELMRRIIEWLYNPAVEETEIVMPKKFELFQNTPNPFKTVTELKYAIPRVSNVELSLYNMAGQKVITLVDKLETPGYKTVKLNAKKLPSGIYFAKFSVSYSSEHLPANKQNSEEFNMIKKLILMK